MITTCTPDARCPRHLASGGTPSDIDPCGALPVSEMTGANFRRIARQYGEEAAALQEGTAPPDLIHYLAERVQDLASMLCEADARCGRAEQERGDLAEQLLAREREIAGWTAAAAIAERALATLSNRAHDAEQERDALRAELARLRDRLDEMALDLGHERAAHLALRRAREADRDQGRRSP